MDNKDLNEEKHDDTVGDNRSEVEEHNNEIDDNRSDEEAISSESEETQTIASVQQVQPAQQEHQEQLIDTGKRSSWYRGPVPWMVATFVLLLAFVYVLAANPTHSDEVVAKVNGQAIKKDQLYQEMVKASGANTLQQMIMTELIDQEAKKEHIQVTDQDINDEIDKIKKNFTSEDQFNQALAQQGLTLESLQQQMRTEVEINKIFASKVTVSDNDIQKFFDQNKDQMGKPEQVRAAHIVLSSKEAADTVMSQLNKGGDFADLAKQKSIDTATKDDGGDMGYFSSGQQDPAIEQVAFKLNPGQVSDVVQTQSGYEIIRVTDHKDAEPAKLADVKEQIHDQLFSQQVNQQFQAWYQQLEANADIENHLNDDTAKSNS